MNSPADVGELSTVGDRRPGFKQRLNSLRVNIKHYGPLRLTHDHLAHMQAVAEGVPIADAAKRYLGIEHVAAARRAHRQVVNLAAHVSHRQFAGWPEIASLPMLPSNDPCKPDFGAAGTVRRAAAVKRLQEQRLAALQVLAGLAVQSPSPTDRIDGWLACHLTEALGSRGIYLLGELQALISRGGRWWQGIPAFGPVKAQRLADDVALLIPSPVRPVFVLPFRFPEALSGRHGTNRAQHLGGDTDVDDDLAALTAWISLHSGSEATSLAYNREARRYILWMTQVRHRAASDATPEDCRAYMDFLAAVPETWISRRRVTPGLPGWAPFSGPLTVQSQQQAIAVILAWYSWMVSAGYLRGNPWTLIQRRWPKVPRKPPSRAFSAEGFKALADEVEHESDPAAQARWRWFLAFSLATGLRPAELVGATRGALYTDENDHWWATIVGRGAKTREVFVPEPAVVATREYFAFRGLDFNTSANCVPLMASLTDCLRPISYTSIAQAFKRFVHRAAKHAELSDRARSALVQASLNWLRHTHATRGVERGVPLDVIQANLGHENPASTAKYFKAQDERRAGTLEKAFGAD